MLELDVLQHADVLEEALRLVRQRVDGEEDLLLEGAPLLLGAQLGGDRVGGLALLVVLALLLALLVLALAAALLGRRLVLLGVGLLPQLVALGLGELLALALGLGLALALALAPLFEQQILFAPLTALEVCDRRIQDKVIV